MIPTPVFLLVLVSVALGDWVSVRDDLCYNPYVRSLNPALCARSCDECILTGSTANNNRAWCQQGSISFSPDTTLTQYTFPTGNLQAEGFCWTGNVFTLSPKSSSFTLLNKTVSLSIDCTYQLLGIPMYLQCDLPGNLLLLFPIVLFLIFLVFLCICIICCCRYGSCCQRSGSPTPPRRPPKKKAPEPKADTTILNFMKNNVELDSFAHRPDEDSDPESPEGEILLPPGKKGNAPVFPLSPKGNAPVFPMGSEGGSSSRGGVEGDFDTNSTGSATKKVTVPDLDEFENSNENDIDVIFEGGEVNLAALGFQDEIF